MNWDAFELLLAIERAGSITGAARVLQTHAATVTRRLAAVERRLGRSLFDRTVKPLAIDADARGLVKAAEHMERDARVSLLDLGDASERMAGPIVIGLPDASVARLMMPAVAGFLRDHPLLEPTILTYATTLDIHLMATAMLRRQIDVMIAVSSSPPAALFGRRLLVPDHGWFARPDIAADPSAGVIGWRHPADDADYLPDAARARVRVRTDNMLTMLEAAANGLGHAWLPHALAETAPALVPVPGTVSQVGTDVWVLCHPQAKSVRRVRALMTALAQ